MYFRYFLTAHLFRRLLKVITGNGGLTSEDLTTLYTQPKKLRPDSLVAGQSEPVKDGRLRPVDVVLVEAGWLLEERERALAPLGQSLTRIERT